MASVHHFRPLGFTRSEIQEAAAWTARRGTGWHVEPVPTDRGALGMIVVEPGEDDPAFQVERTAAGVGAFCARTFRDLGVFATLGAALEAGAERADRMRGHEVANVPEPVE